MNTIFDIIKNRRSVGNLSLPMPTPEQINALIELAMCAPDHKQLQPYRFVVLTESGKAQLSQALLQAAVDESTQKNEVLSEQERHKIVNMTARAPMILVCITHYQDHEKVPHFEQLLSIGAATQNILLGLHSLGYQSIWRSGPLMNAPAVKKLFDVQQDNIITGFIYIGSSDIVMPPKKSIVVQDFVEYR